MYSWVGFCFVGHLWAVVIVTRHESWFRPFEPRGVRMYGACFSTDRKTTYHAPPFVLHELLKRRCAMCTSFFFSSLTSSTEPSFFFRLITFFCVCLQSEALFLSKVAYLCLWTRSQLQEKNIKKQTKKDALCFPSANYLFILFCFAFRTKGCAHGEQTRRRSRLLQYSLAPLLVPGWGVHRVVCTPPRPARVALAGLSSTQSWT